MGRTRCAPFRALHSVRATGSHNQAGERLTDGHPGCRSSTIPFAEACKLNGQISKSDGCLQ